MPARSERLTIVPRADGEPCAILRRPAWWDHGAFAEAFRARELDLGNPIDWNLAWLLSAAEAAAWNEVCWSRLADGPSRPDPRLLDEKEKLDALLRNAAWVVVESNEWESGLS